MDCNKCGSKLEAGVNWSPSRAKQNNRICNPCNAAYYREHNAKKGVGVSTKNIRTRIVKKLYGGSVKWTGVNSFDLEDMGSVTVRSSTIRTIGDFTESWQFTRGHLDMDTTDYILCIALKNKQGTPERVWLIPTSTMWRKHALTISRTTLAKWNKHVVYDSTYSMKKIK